MVNEQYEKARKNLENFVNGLTVEEFRNNLNNNKSSDVTRAIAIALYRPDETEIREQLVNDYITDDFLKRAVLANIPSEQIYESYNIYSKNKELIKLPYDSRVKVNYLEKICPMLELTDEEKDFFISVILKLIEPEQADYSVEYNNPDGGVLKNTSETSDETAQVDEIPEPVPNQATDSTDKLDQLSTELIKGFFKDNCNLSDAERTKIEDFFNSYKVVINRNDDVNLNTNADTEKSKIQRLREAKERMEQAFNKITKYGDEYTKRGSIDPANRLITINAESEDTELDTLKAITYFKSLALSGFRQEHTNPETDEHNAMAKTLTELVMEGNTLDIGEKDESSKAPKTTVYNIDETNDEIKAIMYILAPKNEDLQVMQNWFLGDQTRLQETLECVKPSNSDTKETKAISYFDLALYARNRAMPISEETSLQDRAKRDAFSEEPINIFNYVCEQEKNGNDNIPKFLKRMVCYFTNSNAIGQLYFKLNPKKEPECGFDPGVTSASRE